ncbi:MAG: dTDP-4-dehydrorhamnose 3,5-epimerase family protein [Hyphomicrobiales bacterium]|uniref:dTDP-4-dehydrorhamnose 3,5-epimerase family protein n=1 Tax=Roseibium polysiphoniae TaxID=2571221 RepID=UPI003299334C
MISSAIHPFSLLLRTPTTIGDSRGKVEILYETDNVVLKRSTSAKGVFRGLHRQCAPQLQNKIIRVISGRILDFVADPDDPKGAIWYREITSTEEWVHIAANFAHGFYALENVVFEYFCEGGYNEEAEESYFVADLLQKELSFGAMYLSAKDQSGEPLIREVRPAP